MRRNFATMGWCSAAVQHASGAGSRRNPDMKGLRVPGMSKGSAGMDALVPDQYQALTISENGRTAWLTQH
jgi:hypothetical protein